MSQPKITFHKRTDDYAVLMDENGDISVAAPHLLAALEAAEKVAATAISFIECVCEDDPVWQKQAATLNDEILAFRKAAIAATKTGAA